MLLEAKKIITNELQTRQKPKAGYELLGSELEFSVSLRAASLSVRQERSCVRNSHWIRPDFKSCDRN